MGERVETVGGESIEEDEPLGGWEGLEVGDGGGLVVEEGVWLIIPENKQGSCFEACRPMLRRMDVTILYQWCGLRRKP